jgi:hypothetical protein
MDMGRWWLPILAVLLFWGCNNNPKREFVKEISCYYDYSTVDWSELSEKYYRPNTADWDSATGNRIIEGFPMEIAANFWHILQNARTDFHQKSLPLRENASKDVINALNKTEAMFDTVFVRCVSQEYYMRLLPEMYNETMKPAIDELVEQL